jgi:hypothetical protein
MNQLRYGVNALQVGEVELLLTVTSGGTAVHLAHVANPEDAGRAAVHEYYFDANRRSAPLELTYDRAALLATRWAPLTLCGREWAVMIAGEGGPLSELNDEVAFAPTCGRCLAIMDKLFPAPAPDQRLPLLAKLGADSILEHGHAEVRDVPGDQQQALRTAVRSLVRQRAGESCRSYVHESVIFFVSEAIYAEHAEDNMRAAAEAIDRALTGRDTTPIHEPAWRLSWDTWDIS